MRRSWFRALGALSLLIHHAGCSPDPAARDGGAAPRDAPPGGPLAPDADVRTTDDVVALDRAPIAHDAPTVPWSPQEDAAALDGGDASEEPPWPDDAGGPDVVSGSWGTFPDGPEAYRSFRLPLRREDARLVLSIDPDGRAWLAGATIARTRTIGGTAPPSLLTLLDAEGRIVAALTGGAEVTWIEADRDGATLALRAHGPARVGGLRLDASPGDCALLRADRDGRARWVAPLPGVAEVQGVRVDARGLTSTARVNGAAPTTLGGRAIEAGRVVRVVLDDAGVITEASPLGRASGRLARAQPLDDGGAMTFELAPTGGPGIAVRRYDAAGGVRWERQERIDDAVFDAQGRSWILTSDALVGVDETGRTRWRTSVPAVGRSWSYASWIRTRTGHSLRRGDRWIAVVDDLDDLDQSSTEYGISACRPPSLSRLVLGVRFSDLSGREIPSSGAEWSSAQALAVSDGRACAVTVMGAPGMPEREGAIACDGARVQGRCAGDGYCGPCAADLLNDARHCGACERRCADASGALGRCLAGVCVSAPCPEARADCDGNSANGCEVDVARDPANCGACGAACLPGRSCGDGRCEGTTVTWSSDGRDGDFAPTRDAVLPSGVYYFRDVTVPADVTVRTTSGGVLDLRASGDVRIAGTIDVSGGDGQDAVPRASGGSTGGGRTEVPGAAGSGPAGGGGALAPSGRGGGGGAPGLPVHEHLDFYRCSGGFERSPAQHATLGEDPAYDGDDLTRYGRCTPESTSALRFCEVLRTRSGGFGGTIGRSALMDLAAAATFQPGSGGGASVSAGGAGGGAGGRRAAHRLGDAGRARGPRVAARPRRPRRRAGRRTRLRRRDRRRGPRGSSRARRDGERGRGRDARAGAHPRHRGSVAVHPRRRLHAAVATRLRRESRDGIHLRLVLALTMAATPLEDGATSLAGCAPRRPRVTGRDVVDRAVARVIASQAAATHAALSR